MSIRRPFIFDQLLGTLFSFLTLVKLSKRAYIVNSQNTTTATLA